MSLQEVIDSAYAQVCAAIECAEYEGQGGQAFRWRDLSQFLGQHTLTRGENTDVSNN